MGLRWRLASQEARKMVWTILKSRRSLSTPSPSRCTTCTKLSTPSAPCSPLLLPLATCTEYARKQIGCKEDKPLFLVMHGGSGSTAAEIQEAVSNGVVKMNIDTDTQWAFWEGLKNFYEKNKG